MLWYWATFGANAAGRRRSRCARGRSATATACSPRTTRARPRPASGARLHVGGRSVARPHRLGLRRRPSRARDGDAQGRGPLERDPVRRAALAAVLLVALAGCGSSSSTSSAGGATLWVTRDRGAHVLHSTRVPAGESVLQALDRVAKVKTRFGGRYVRGDRRASRSTATGRWFYYVNGYLADRSAADYRLRKGDLAWWDYRSWRNPAQDPVVVGAFPQPFLRGYDGRRRQTVIVSVDPDAVRALARRLHAQVVGPGVGTLSRNVNVVYVQPGGGEAARAGAGRRPHGRRARQVHVPRRPEALAAGAAVPLPLRGRRGEPGSRRAASGGAGGRGAARRPDRLGRRDRARAPARLPARAAAAGGGCTSSARSARASPSSC